MCAINKENKEVNKWKIDFRKTKNMIHKVMKIDKNQLTESILKQDKN